MTTTAPRVDHAMLSAEPDYPTLWGHPRPLWMLFMAEFWERFAFYGIRWALTLYIVAEFFQGAASGQAAASKTYGAYLALVYASAIFGGYVADRLIGYQRSILAGALIMSAGLFMIMLPSQPLFLAGLATVIVGNGLFKPNISTLVGKIYPAGDPRRDRGFSIFYMGINLGGMVSPLVTHWLASLATGTSPLLNYRMVFAAAGVGMLLSFLWFQLGRRQLQGLGSLPPAPGNGRKTALVVAGALAAILPVYLLLEYVPAATLAWVLLALFCGLAVNLYLAAAKHGSVARQRVIAMLLMFAFNVIFFMFFEQAGSSFNFLAQNIVDRQVFDGFELRVAWFQSLNSGVIVLFAPLVTMVWAALAARQWEPSIPRKFALGLLGNALGFAVLMFALTRLVDSRGLIPFWTLIACYALQTIGELCLSPIGLSMVSKLVPSEKAGLAFGGWFLSTAIGNNFSGLLASDISGETGMTIQSALGGFTFSFWLLAGAAVLLFICAPRISKLMHGVK
ncbi:peptide MFS transporter [Pseudoduganella sp. OTU4001]|uniref:peptide MFS transporter n=1 Tax=Pseudoduganella sp. OTU4001 TaxID=3043854 RepID=UPI00313B8C63